MVRLCILILSVLISSSALGSTAYQCIGADGKVTFQDKPCAAGQRQQKIQLDDSQPSAPPPAAVPESRAVASPQAPQPRPAEPVAPLPVMYICSRATDGKTYFSDIGNPPPYQAPYGVVGSAQLSLAQAYGPPNGGGASAPELNRGRVNPGMIANYYVWVQDACRQLTPGETCRALRDAYDENETKLQRAFKSDQPPLEKRERELHAQLQSC